MCVENVKNVKFTPCCWGTRSTWWFIPRIVSGLVHPNCKWIKPTYPMKITRVVGPTCDSWVVRHQVGLPAPGGFQLHLGRWNERDSSHRQRQKSHLRRLRRSDSATHRDEVFSGERLESFHKAPSLFYDCFCDGCWN